jgi:hypothetical protein
VVHRDHDGIPLAVEQPPQADLLTRGHAVASSGWSHGPRRAPIATLSMFRNVSAWYSDAVRAVKEE